MTPGTGRSVVVHRFGRAGARPKAYLQAAIHANELPGAMALHHLMPMLAAADRARRIRGEIVVVPTVNPIGQAQLVGSNHLGRYDFLGRDNFNRNWLDLSGAVAERVARRGCRMVIGLEGSRIRTDVEAALTFHELETAGCRDKGEDPGWAWLKHRYAVSYRMSPMFRDGAFVDAYLLARFFRDARPSAALAARETA